MKLNDVLEQYNIQENEEPALFLFDGAKMKKGHLI